MSWEEMYKKEVVCPCKKGKIVLTTYGDDWNRTKESISFECDDCKKKYKIVEERNQRLLPSDGSWTTYMLLPKDYPDFDSAINIVVDKCLSFKEELIVCFTKKELIHCLEDYEENTRVKGLRGTSSRIAKLSKEMTKSARMEDIIEAIKYAIINYDNTPNNKNEKIKIEEENRKQYKEYVEERNKHAIVLDF